MNTRYREQQEEMIARGVALLASGLTESAMRRRLAIEFGFDHRDLGCVEAAAGIRFETARAAGTERHAA